MAIEGIVEQIKSDEGVCGARIRKQAQRAKDVNPVRESSWTPAVAEECALSVEELEDIVFFAGKL